MPIGQALAADIVVDADCSLQNAVRSANGEELVEPLLECEVGDVDADGSDTIMLDISGTDEGVIALDETLDIQSEVVIEGSGFVISGGNSLQIFNVSAGSLTLNNLTMRDGFSAGNGGAIAVNGAVLALNNSVVSSSSAAGLGGGIYALDSDVTLVGSVLSGNQTGAEIAIATEEDDNAEEDGDVEESEAAQAVEVWVDSFGGGLYFAGKANSLVIEKSGLDNNVSPSDGGGLYIASGSADISNSTISSNVAAVDGGGIYNAGSSILAHVTIVDNVAAAGGGLVDAHLMQLYNSIISDNTGADCFGTLNANLGNMIRDLSCSHEELSADPDLLLLGGSPAYYLPQEGSPVIDAALADYCLPTDQRDIDRLPEACDIGAAEFQPGIFEFQIQSAMRLLSRPEPAASVEPEPEEGEEEPSAPPSTCQDLPSYISVPGAPNSVQCKEVDAAGVGNKTLVDYGFYRAVDIFGYIPGTVKACFEYHTGAVALLDAANSPRNIIPLQTRTEGNMRCANVDRPGTAVLMPIDFFASGLVVEPIWNINSCTVTTTDILNLRAEPSTSSGIVANVLNNVQLAANQKTTYWFRVDYYGIFGWLHQDYLNSSGTCE